MPHKNALAQLKTYGPLAVKLDRLDDAVDAAADDRNKWKIKLAKFVEFCAQPEAKDLIGRFLDDKYGSIRTTAASSLLHLWEAQDLIPFDHQKRDRYERDMREYQASLKWTIPLLLKAIADPQEWPSHHALMVARKLYDVDEETRRIYREALLSVSKSRYKGIRLDVVKTLAGLYPSNDDALSVLDEAGMQCLIDGTRDPDIKVRNWATFGLHLSVANLDNEAEAAFRERLAKEDPDSDVHLEALIGLAGLSDDPEVTLQICERLEKDDNFGSGWIDAVERSQQPDCLLALIEAHKRILAKYPNDNIIEQIEQVFIDWNDDV
jgi:hypothetical protein